jgi:YebC/PmpR family DNA-binding regulatory protein
LVILEPVGTLFRSQSPGGGKFMAGHSHWAGIKHKKAVVDAKRGKLWSKLARVLMSAARTGGGDPGMNLSLKYAIDKAKAANMPKDTIERAILKGTGELEGEELLDIFYEGYGAGGVAILVEALTDNRNRTVGEIRRIFEKRGGNLGSSGCVKWQFEQKGVVTVASEGTTEEALLEIVLEAGAEDIENLGDAFQITAPVADISAVADAIEAAGLERASSELAYLPTSTTPVADANDGRKIFALLEDLDDHDDVQNTYSNFDIDDDLLAQIQQD